MVKPGEEEKDIQDRTANAGQPEQDSQERKTRKDCQNGTQPGRYIWPGQDRTVKTSTRKTFDKILTGNYS
jgi:hypothetical protein